MTRSEIHTLVFSEKREWRELFYLKIDRSGSMRIRSSFQNHYSPVQLVLDQQSQLFNSILDHFDTGLIHQKGLYRKPDKNLNRELTVVFSREESVYDNCCCFHFTGDRESFKNTLHEALFIHFDQLMSTAKQKTELLIQDARKWSETGIRPDRLPEGTVINLTLSQRNEYNQFMDQNKNEFRRDLKKRSNILPGRKMP